MSNGLRAAIIVVLSGFALVAGYSWQSVRSGATVTLSAAAPRTEHASGREAGTLPPGDSAGGKALAGEVDAMRERVRELQQEVGRLRERLPAGRPPLPATGQGRVVDRIAGAESELDPQADAPRRRRWEARIREDNEVAVGRLTETLGLDGAQEAELSGALELELVERSRLLDDYAAQRMGYDELRERVRINREGALRRFRAVLTEEQKKAYDILPPSARVLATGLSQED